MLDFTTLFDRLKEIEQRLEALEDGVKLMPVLISKRQENRKAIESLARDIDDLRRQ